MNPNTPCSTCGHPMTAHIYHEGACRPGFACECQRFTSNGPTPLTELERYKLAYAILREPFVDWDDILEISEAVVRGEPVSWDTYPPHTRDHLQPLWRGRA